MLPSLIQLVLHGRFIKVSLCSDMEIKYKVWQVAELEQSRDNLLLENQQLIGNLTGLQSSIQNPEKSGSPSFPIDVSVKVCLLDTFTTCSKFTCYLNV